VVQDGKRNKLKVKEMKKHGLGWDLDYYLNLFHIVRVVNVKKQRPKANHKFGNYGEKCNVFEQK